MTIVSHHPRDLGFGIVISNTFIRSIAFAVAGAMLMACSGSPATPAATAPEPKATYRTLWSLTKVLHVGSDHVVVRDYDWGMAGYDIHDLDAQIWYLKRIGVRGQSTSKVHCKTRKPHYCPGRNADGDILLMYCDPRIIDRCLLPPASLPARGWIPPDNCGAIEIIDVVSGVTIQSYLDVPEITLDRDINGTRVSADTDGIKVEVGEESQTFSQAFDCGGNLHALVVGDDSASIVAVKSVLGKMSVENILTVPASSADGVLIFHDGKVGLVAPDAVYLENKTLPVDPPLGPIISVTSQGLVFTEPPVTSGPQPLTVGTDLLPGALLCEKLEPRYCDN